jgi:hypothetical protein
VRIEMATEIETKLGGPACGGMDGGLIRPDAGSPADAGSTIADAGNRSDAGAAPVTGGCHCGASGDLAPLAALAMTCGRFRRKKLPG